MEVEVSHVHWRWVGVELLPRRTADPGDIVTIGGRVHGSFEATESDRGGRGVRAVGRATVVDGGEDYRGTQWVGGCRCGGW